MTIKIIACEVIKEELLTSAQGLDVDFYFLPQGRHNYPDLLHRELQELLDHISGFERVVLGFGLCGNAIRNLRAGDFILTVPRVYDCIPLLLGSQENYEQHHFEEIRTFYTSRGWTTMEGSIVAEYNRLLSKYGESRAKRIYATLYNNYKRVLFIRTGQTEEERFMQNSENIARLLNLEHHSTEGNLAYIKGLVRGPWPQEEFINVSPGGVVDESFFHRPQPVDF